MNKFFFSSSKFEDFDAETSFNFLVDSKKFPLDDFKKSDWVKNFRLTKVIVCTKKKIGKSLMKKIILVNQWNWLFSTQHIKTKEEIIFCPVHKFYA